MARGQRLREVTEANAIARIAHSVRSNGRRRVDRVAAFGAALSLVGVLTLPFAESRANRIVSGVPVGLADAAGAMGWLLLTLVATAFAWAVFAPVGRVRVRVTLALGVAAFAAFVVAIGTAAVDLSHTGDTVKRVSLGGGAWVALIGIAVIWFRGASGADSRAARRIAAAVGVFAVAAGIVWGGLSELSLAAEYRAQADTFWNLVGGHAVLSLASVGIASLVGVPLGIVAAHQRIVRAIAIPSAGIIQTIPSLALFGMLMVPLAMLGLPTIGTLPTLIALTLYALLPIIRSTYLGVSSVDAAILDAGRGMGMSRRQLLWQVELPLALPLTLEGLRVALVLIIGIAAVMAIGGARDLGTLVLQGWGTQAADLTLLGAVPMVVLSILADQGMRGLQRLIVSPGVRLEAR